MTDLKFQIAQLVESLSSFKPEQPVEWQVGKIANAMIEQAKKEAGGNPIVEAIDPFKPGPNNIYVSDRAGAVRAVLQQLAAALPTEGPMVR